MPPGRPPLIDRSTGLRILLLALAAALALPAAAQVLYKLVDRQGRTTYTDSVPKNFDGTVTRLEPDEAATVLPSVKPAEAATKSAPASGIGEDRRRAREDLGRKLRAAQDKVEAARKAKEEGGEPLPEEMQTIQHRHPVPRSGQPMPNPNCFVAAEPGGAQALNCPSRVPMEAYYERQKKLDEDLRRAEEELALAERAFRRGTD